MLWNALRDRAHAQAIKSGWWEQPRKDEEVLMLILSELSEATEEARRPNQSPFYLIEKKPLGVAVELADVVIRIADWYGQHKRSLEEDTHRLISGNTLFGVNECGQNHAWVKKVDSPLAFFFSLSEHVVLAHSENEWHRLGMVCFKISVYFAQQTWDLEEILELKMKYNATRPYRHGGKTA